MIDARRWMVEIFVGESCGLTYAEAALCDDSGKRARGRGWARPDPLQPDPPGTDEIAVSRALDDLSRRLNGLEGVPGQSQSSSQPAHG